MAVTDEDFKRLEHKLDKVADALVRLIIIDERQIAHAERVMRLEATVAEQTADVRTRFESVEEANRKTDLRVTTWVQRGVGVWAAFLTFWTLWQVIRPLSITLGPGG